MAWAAVVLAAVAIGGAVPLLMVPLSHYEGSDGTCTTMPHNTEWLAWPGAFWGLAVALAALVLGRTVLKPTPRPLHHWSSLGIQARLAVAAVWVAGIAVVLGGYGVSRAAGNVFCNGNLWAAPRA
jgi:hypothetical protein